MRSGVAFFVVCLALVSLVASQLALASMPPTWLTASDPAADDEAMPCHMGDGAAMAHQGKPDTAPCPMMKDGFCFAMCAVAVPSAVNAAVPVRYDSTELPVFEPQALVAQVVSPPQRPPNSL
jgi:hypothetical protein